MKKKIKIILAILMSCILLFVGINVVDLHTSHYEYSTDPIELDGVTYRHKENYDTYLLLGLDSYGKLKSPHDYQGGDRSDVMIVLLVDHDHKTWQMLNLDRDTLVDMHTVSKEGKDEGIVYQQICLSHIFGKSLKENSQSSMNTVSEFLYNEDIRGHYAMNMGGIWKLNDLIGGVEVTLEDDFTDAYADMKKGDTIRLDGDRAYAYLALRMTVDDGTNEARIKRQQNYLKSMIAELKADAKENPLFALKVLFALSGHTDTDIKMFRFYELAKCLTEYTQLPTLSFEGTHQKEQQMDISKDATAYTTFRVDPVSKLHVVLDFFYDKND